MQRLDFYSGLVAAFVAGGYKIIFGWLPQFIAVKSQKENKVVTWMVAITSAFAQAFGKSQVFTAFVTGLLFGRPLEGLAVGAVIELMFLGVFQIGASTPPQPTLATIMTTIFVIRAGATTQEALTIVMPIAVLSQSLFMIAISFEQTALGIAKRHAQDGNIAGVDFDNTFWQWVFIFQILFPAFVGGFIGIPTVQVIVAWIGAHAGWLMEGMGFLSGVLPALGFALLLYQMGTRFVAFLLLGMFVGLYIKPDSLSLAVAGVAMALIYMMVTRKTTTTATPNAAPAAAKAERKLKLTDEDLDAMWWRHYGLFSAACWEVLGGLGMAQTMVPVIRRLYTTKEEISAALKRHMVFYNTNPWIGSIIPGIMASMEEERANGQPVDEAAIQGVKMAMMGPFAGVGDSLFWGTYVPIYIAICASWAQSGNTALMWLAPIVGGGITIVSHLYFERFGIRWGYRNGIAALQNLQQQNLLADLSTAATIVGQFVIGGLVIKLVNLQIRWAPSFFGTSPIKFQTILNSILPSFLPIAVFFLCYYLLKKGWTALRIMILLMVVCILGAYPIPLPLFNNVSILGAPIVEPAKTSLQIFSHLFG